MSIEAKLLRDGLAFVKPALRRRDFAICKHVRLQSAGGELTLLACDLSGELEYKMKMNAPEFDICAPGLQLLAIAEAAGDEIDLRPGKRLGVASSAGRYQLPTLPGPDMPTVKPEGEPSASGTYEAIRKEIEFCAFAADVNNLQRPYLNGVSVNATNGKVSISASDSLLIAFSSIEEDVPDFEILIPTPLCDMAVNERFTRFEVSPGLLTLLGNSCVARLKLSAEKFPLAFVGKILSGAGKPSGSFRAAKDELVRAITAVGLIVEKTEGCALKMNGKLTLSTATVESQATQEIPCEGSNIECGMRIDQLLALAKRADEKAEFSWAEGFPNAGSAPLLVKSGKRIVGAVPYRL